VFVLNNDESVPLKVLAINAFKGKNLPRRNEPGHDDCARANGQRSFVSFDHFDFLYERSFPSLFSLGVAGPSLRREKQVSEKELVTHLLRLHHRRFSSNAQFVYFAHSKVERRIFNGVVASVDESRKLTSLLQQLFSTVNSNEAARKDIEDALTACVANLVPQMSSVKGSAGYWKKQSHRVLSMVNSPIMKAPTFFVTLTAADSLWIDILRLAEPSMSDHELQKLSAVQKADLLAHHADLAVDHFDHRWTSFWQHVLNGEGKPLGNIVDYFWRIEFQERGSPHVHMLLWVQEAEGFSFSNSDSLPEDFLQFIDSTICSKLDLSAAADVVEGATHPCSLLLPEHPLRSADTTQYVERLAQAVQMHRCTKYCKPAGQHSACRFGFPRPNRDHTSVEMVYRNKRTRMVVSTKRNHSRLNAFCPALLAFWAANMDIQYLTDSFGTAVYTASYLCKQEKGRKSAWLMHKLSKTSDSLTVKQQTRRVIMSILNSIEVSIQEALWVRTGEDLCNASRLFIRIPAMHKQVHDRTSGDSVFVATDGQARSFFSTDLGYYENRPENIENLSLFEFLTEDRVTKSSTQGQRGLCLKGTSGIKLYAVPRQRHAIVICPWAISLDESEEFSRLLLYLHAPWRTMQEFRSPTLDSVQVVAEKMSATDSDQFGHLQDMSAHYRDLHDSAIALQNHKAQDEDRGAREQNAMLSDSSEDDDSCPVASDLQMGLEGARPEEDDHNDCPLLERDAMVGRKAKQHGSHSVLSSEAQNMMEQTKRIVQRKGRMEEDDDAAAVEHSADVEAQKRELNDRVASLNVLQRNIFEDFKTDFEAGLQHKTSVVIGPGGTGKSYLIDTLGQYLRCYGSPLCEQEASGFSDNQRHGPLVKAAFTGVAASNVGGITLHNALRSKGIDISGDMDDKELLNLQQEWAQVKVLVIDEISFVSARHLFSISQRLCKIFPQHSNAPFGGLYVWLVGDPYQLPPVKAKTLWPQGCTESLSEKEAMGRDLYLDADQFYELRKGKRNRGRFFEALSRIRTCSATSEDINLLNSRSKNEQSSCGGSRLSASVHIFGTNREVRRHNDKALVSDCSATDSRGKKKRTCRAWTHVSLSKQVVKHQDAAAKRSAIRSCLSRTQRTSSKEKFVPNALCMYTGMRVMLQENACVEIGLFNGASGKIVIVRT